ncbi:serine/threonine kinase [Aureococcus anophagefferens]|nr:serine/threonine kinase [Aureococcus anophagefferens]
MGKSTRSSHFQANNYAKDLASYKGLVAAYLSTRKYKEALCTAKEASEAANAGIDRLEKLMHGVDPDLDDDDDTPHQRTANSADDDARGSGEPEFRAVKVCRKRPAWRQGTDETFAQLRREITALRLLDHPNAWSYEDFEDATHYLFVMEYAAGGELFERLSKRTGRPYGAKVDVWGLGCVLYIMLSGMEPFDAAEDEQAFERSDAGRGAPPAPPRLSKNSYIGPPTTDKIGSLVKQRRLSGRAPSLSAVVSADDDAPSRRPGRRPTTSSRGIAAGDLTGDDDDGAAQHLAAATAASMSAETPDLGLRALDDGAAAGGDDSPERSPELKTSRRTARASRSSLQPRPAHPRDDDVKAYRHASLHSDEGSRRSRRQLDDVCSSGTENTCQLYYEEMGTSVDGVSQYDATNTTYNGIVRVGHTTFSSTRATTSSRWTTPCDPGEFLSEVGAAAAARAGAAGRFAALLLAAS